MFYSNNNGYMEDLYFYNQFPNNTYMNNQSSGVMPIGYMNQNLGNPNFQNQINSNSGFSNSNGMYMGNQGMVPFQNLNTLYPSVYRIINPVVSRIVSNGNNQSINEDTLNNMVDTVFNIVEGQIDIEEDTISRNISNENQTISNSSSSNNTTTNLSTRTADTSRQTTQNNHTRNNKNDSLLRDLIKILIIKTLLARNQFQRQYNFPMNNGYNPFFQ